jgi:WD40 repeat protein
LLFAETEDTNWFRSDLDDYLEDSLTIPQYLIHFKNLAEEIWLLENFDDYVIAVDAKSCIHLFKNGVRVKHCSRTHGKSILSVKFFDYRYFATMSCDRTIKIWNRDLKCIYTYIENVSILSMVFASSYLLVSQNNKKFCRIKLR